eukprot:TRINITY_DN7901_c0_g1_i2.p2 TRINITY_DN7901_c0_g1~~TRINITY_DN7901_c0_g1_i2.p2  ORF type:complete len:302 (-),score=49.19 TRINITY_DN7901_c0_g1_i2:85-990(-)
MRLNINIQQNNIGDQKMNLKITTLIENKIDDKNVLINEHGLSVYIEVDKIKILFDTGQSGDFIKNAEKLKINLNDLNYVLMSHGHYDHSGGFRKLLDSVNKSFKLIVGEGFFDKKYKYIENGNYKFNGNSFDDKLISENNIPIKYIDEDVYELNEKILVFSNFERKNNYEKLNKKFYIKKDEKYINDNFSDEISLGIKHEKGLIVIVGCSHVGIVNILETIIKRTGMNIYAVIGGSHLVEADEVRLNNTMNYFREKNIEMLRLSHCTGEKAVARLEEEFKEKFEYNNCGNVIKFNQKIIGI